MSSPAPTLPYLMVDADQHSTPPRDAYERYIDPDKRHLAIKFVEDEQGRLVQTFNGRPQRWKAKNFQVVASDDKLKDLGVKGAGSDVDAGGAAIPGSLLTKLNPLKDLDEAGRKEFAKKYRALQAHLDNPADRLTVMDSQGIEACVNFAGPLGIEPEFEGDLEGLYANIRAVNRWIADAWGYNHQNRIFTPPFMSFADPVAAEAELDQLLQVPGFDLLCISTGPSMHTSPFRPELDRFWAKCNEAGVNITNHLSNITRYGAQGLEWSEEEVMLGDMNAFQWVFYYGDRPAMETVGAAILQGFFAQNPNIRFLVAEQGTVWLPYLVRKMDHAYLMGRKGSYGRKLEKRPSDYLKQHVLVAPFPEENVSRIVEAVGVAPLVFASDFPHGEGLPEPALYVTQLEKLSPEDQRAVMRDNLAAFLGIGG